MHPTIQDEHVESDVKDGVQQAKEVAKQAVGQVQQKAQEVAGQAQAQAKSAITGRKDQLVEGLWDVTRVFRTTGEQLRDQDRGAAAQYVDKVADQIDRFSNYLEERDLDQLITEAGNMARRQPELFLGGAFLVGLMVGRFLKSSSQQRAWAGRETGAMGYQPYEDNYPVEDFSSTTPSSGTASTRVAAYQMPNSTPEL